MDSILLIDLDNCVRCHACEVACREEHNLAFEGGPRWCRIMTVGPRQAAGELQMDFIPVMCFHCDEPACAEFCPVGAISKGEDGVVLVDEDVCTGCRLCVYGCPHGVMAYNEATRTAGHCDLCAVRRSGGLEPSCVQHCIGGALQWVTPEELATITRGEHTLMLGRTCYVSSKWNLQHDV